MDEQSHVLFAASAVRCPQRGVERGKDLLQLLLTTQLVLGDTSKASAGLPDAAACLTVANRVRDALQLLCESGRASSLRATAASSAFAPSMAP